MTRAFENSDAENPVAPAVALKELPKLGAVDIFQRLMHASQERNDMLSGLRRSHEKYGEAVATNLPGMKMVNLFGPDANRFVLLDQERIFSARKPWMMIMGKIFPNGLLLLDGDEHKLNRKVMHTAFTRPALRGYTERMNTIVAEEIPDWHRSGKSFEAFPHVKQLTLTMAARIFFGIELGAEMQLLNRAMESLVAASMSRVRLKIPGLEFYRGLKAREFMIQFIGEMIPERRQGESSDIFSRLCRTVTDEGERFDDQQIIDHMSFLMMAAHDTTTSTLSSILYELGRHQVWQDRVREESLAHGATNIGFDELDGFPAISLVMKETLRRYPPLPVIPRVALRDFEFKGYRVPAGSMVVVSALHTHYLPEWWDDPERFDPERFTPERAEDGRHTHSYIPFGGGQHMCLGLRFAESQVKIILHHLVRRYRWSLPDGYTMPVQQAPISKPRDGLPLRLEPLA
ncbi:MAG: cytochrome P450 [Deltaproteobacteria bacterium]|nr:cytochrome P450 [Deltaproteobacteria bacterium]